jgi:phosphate-selective porin OprO/OprP
MRHPIIATTLMAALGSFSFTATATDGHAAEIALLKQQLASLQAQLQALEERTTSLLADKEPAPSVDQPTKEAARVETNGGIKVVSADKQFEASLGGRIHFDAYAFDRDLANAVGTTEFRRARLTVAGKFYGWDYRMEQDFAAGANLEGLRDVYIARRAMGGKFTIGQFKPYRSMEELTSSNDILMMERPFASASGVYAGRQF